MTTIFCQTTLPIFGDHVFYLDGNSKITWGNGSYEHPVPNALSLPHISCCPGSTERCRESCYVHGLRKLSPETYHHYELNELAIHAALMTNTRARLAAAKLAGWINENASGGFRWHVSGDVFSLRYAEWIVEVCQRSRAVPHWIYTRTLDAVPQLTRAANLVVNISCDEDNFERAAAVAKLAEVAGRPARLCYLVSLPDEKIPELPPGSVIFPDYPLRGRALTEPTSAPWWQGLSIEERRMVCPADFFGQSEQHRCGPCRKCLVSP